MSYIQHFELKDDDGKITNFFVTTLSVGHMVRAQAEAYAQSFLKKLEEMNLPNAKHIVINNPENTYQAIVIPENVMVGNLTKEKAEEIIVVLRKRFALKQLKEL